MLLKSVAKELTNLTGREWTASEVEMLNPKVFVIVGDSDTKIQIETE